MVFFRFRWFAYAALALLLTGCPGPGAKAPTAAQTPQATAPAVQAPAPATPAPQGPSPEAVHQEQIQKLIEQVNAAYAAGDADYLKGRLPEAKVQFDHAVDLMLTSGFDIKTEPALEDEFNRIIDQVNALEMEALKVGNGFVPNEEETPAEVASDVTFAANPAIEAKARPSWPPPTPTCR